MAKYLFHSRKSWLFLAALLQLAALSAMMIDTTPSGFGTLTLWIAPILFFVGLVCPIFYFSNGTLIKDQWHLIKKNSFRSLGACLAFLAALITYLITLEPTASLWDCSETIAAAYKLQVPHTPGTPLTLLLGRLFAMLALNNVYQVAWAINFMSAFFLRWL